jgi:hypothetical protein
VFLLEISFGALVLLALAPQARAATFIGSLAAHVRGTEKAEQFAHLSVRNGVGNRNGVGGFAYASCSSGRVR